MKKAVAYLNPFISPPSVPPKKGGKNLNERRKFGYETGDPQSYKLISEFALKHRKNPTEAEELIWKKLRNKKLENFKFRRQHIIGKYIADFVCLNKKLVVEIDGLIHQLPENKEKDRIRTKWLEKNGYKVIRFSNDEVLKNIDKVLNSILIELKKRNTFKPSNIPSIGGGKGVAKILLATVKGDVHDIGKNIVGVVLGCNNYDVIDLGVMVSSDKILQTAVDKDVDIIGLSGLITPSLDEMVHVAKEMERRGIKKPLLIGGATTSRIHTAVKIIPNFSGSTIHVLDASISVPIVSNLLNKDKKERESFVDKYKSEYEKLRTNYLSKRSEKKLITLDEARNNLFKINWNETEIKTPNNLGVKKLNNYPLKEIAEYIDWTPFFLTWEFKGRYPKIFKNEKYGTEAKKLFDDANKLLDKIIKENLLTANGVVGIFPANSVNFDDIEIYSNEKRESTIKTLHTLRQQSQKSKNKPNIALADFIAPKETGINDYIGAFAVTTGIGLEKIINKFEQEQDDYSSILSKALADRLAEAFAELLHEKTRKEYWGYSHDENFTNEEKIKESYVGIRPAPGYPSQPDHTEKPIIFDLLNVTENTGITLTENLAMYPAASVCGLYFSHPESKYFNIGKLGKDQILDYHRRKGMSISEVEKWLGTNLSY